MLKAAVCLTKDEMAEKYTHLAHGGYPRCFGCGFDNAIGLKLEFQVAEDKSILCLTTIPDGYEGPPGCVHGGVIATMLDETMHKTVRALGVAVAVTRSIEIEYRRPVPIGKPLRVEARHLEQNGHKHCTEARILDESKSVLATAKALFIELDGERRKSAKSA